MHEIILKPWHSKIPGQMDYVAPPLHCNDAMPTCGPLDKCPNLWTVQGNPGRLADMHLISSDYGTAIAGPKFIRARKHVLQWAGEDGFSLWSGGGLDKKLLLSQQF